MMNWRLKLLPEVETEQLIHIVKSATSQNLKVCVALHNGAHIVMYDILEIAQELARRFPLSNNKVMP